MTMNNCIKMAIHRITAGTAVLALASPALAQGGSLPFHTSALQIGSGTHRGLPLEDPVAWEHLIQMDGAEWLRIRFGDWDLGRASRVTLTSIEDGETHELDAREIEKWQGASAYFNGDAVLVRLLAAPEDDGVFVELTEVLVGDSAAGVFQETICGTNDNRTSSNNDRIGRLRFQPCSANAAFCTAWRATNGAMVTAGHCVDFDPDQDGPALPDGVHDLTNSVVEFNVPASDANGTINCSAVADQFPFDGTKSPSWRFDGSGTGLGKDWGVFAVTANALGELPHDRYGIPLRTTRELPAGSDDVRVTGYGTDDRPGPGLNSDNQTQQTHSGGFNGESSSGGDIVIDYRVDTEGGNSGSPVMWFQSELLVIGIHTNGGCNVLPGTNNHGTSCEVNALENALQTWVGSSVEYADRGHPLPVTETGQIYRPWDTVTEAVNAVPAGGTVAVVAGTYSAANGDAFTTSKALTIVAPCGTVTIGN